MSSACPVKLLLLQFLIKCLPRQLFSCLFKKIWTLKTSLRWLFYNASWQEENCFLRKRIEIDGFLAENGWQLLILYLSRLARTLVVWCSPTQHTTYYMSSPKLFSLCWCQRLHVQTENATCMHQLSLCQDFPNGQILPTYGIFKVNYRAFNEVKFHFILFTQHHSVICIIFSSM